MEEIEKEIILKDFILHKDNINFTIKLIKCPIENNLIFKAYKNNSIYNNLFIKKITIAYFRNLYFDFQKLNKIESIIEILLDIINNKSIIIKEIKYDSILMILRYKKCDIKLLLEKVDTTNIEKKFINNPNIFYKEIITNNNDSCGISDIFEIFIDFNNNNILASPNKLTHRIDLYNLDNKNILIKSLKGHNNYITFIKSFNDIIKNRKYLVSIDNIKLIIIWDIKNNYIKKKLLLDYKGIIYSSLLLFNIYDNDYVITSSYNVLEHSKLYTLNKTKFIRNIFSTDNNYTRYMIPWEKENYEGFYIIEFCDSKISIINIFEDEIYLELNTDNKNEKYCNGFLYYKNNEEYLCSGGWSGNIYIWNLKEIVLENVIETCAYNGIGYLIRWSNNIIIGTDFIDRGLIIVDLNIKKIVSLYQNIHNKGIVCIKKFNHYIYGESLIVGSNDGIIKLWLTSSI